MRDVFKRFKRFGCFERFGCLFEIFLELVAALLVFLLGLVIVPALVAIDVFKWLRKEFRNSF